MFNVNQKIAIAAIAAFVLCAFVAPNFAYDHKIDECVKTYKRVSGAEENGLRIVCTRIVNGSYSD